MHRITIYPIIIALFTILLLLACEYINPTPISQVECDEPWLMNEVMELSVKSSNVFRIVIIKIYDPKEVSSTDGRLPFHTGAGMS